jgi:hypothetical protein
MLILSAVRHRRQEIAVAATTAAEALDAGRVVFLPPELARVLGRLDAVVERLEAAYGLRELGVDLRGAPQEPPPAGRSCGRKGPRPPTA